MLREELVNVKGDIIQGVELPFSIYYKPLWKSLEENDARNNLKKIARFSPSESIACEWALAKVYSEMSHYVVPKRAEHLRTLALEIQHILWDLDYQKNILSSLSDEVYLQHIFYLKDMIQDLQELWTGARILPNLITITGVERDLTVGIKSKMKETMKYFSSEFHKTYKLLQEDRSLKDRLKEVLFLPAQVVKNLELGGVLSLGCGINQEIHLKKSYGAYEKLDPFMPKVSLAAQDANSRFYISLERVVFTIQTINKLLDIIPQGDYDLKEKNVYEPNAAYYIAGIDAPSGPLYATYAFKKIYLSSSSIRMAPYISELLKGQHIEDYNLALASLGFDIEQGSLC